MSGESENDDDQYKTKPGVAVLPQGQSVDDGSLMPTVPTLKRVSREEIAIIRTMAAQGHLGTVRGSCPPP
jgi:hypothetical protein